MSRFWAAESSSEDEKGSDNDSLSDVAPVQKQVEKKFAGTYDESDSGTLLWLTLLIPDNH